MAKPPPKPPPTVSAQLGLAIRSLRNAQDLTIEELADRADVSWTYLSTVERCKRNPSWSIVLKVAGALEIDVGELARLAEKQTLPD